jgi:hypothetical protein
LSPRLLHYYIGGVFRCRVHRCAYCFGYQIDSVCTICTGTGTSPPPTADCPTHRPYVKDPDSALRYSDLQGRCRTSKPSYCSKFAPHSHWQGHINLLSELMVKGFGPKP